MTTVITAQDVKDRCPDILIPDAAINDLIAVMTCRLDDCLNAAYPNCQEQARIIKVYAVCHFAESQAKSGQIKSRRWPNGAAESYGVWASGGGLQATRFGQLILSLDTAACVRQAFPDNQRRFVGSVGTSGSRDTPYSLVDRVDTT